MPVPQLNNATSRPRHAPSVASFFSPVGARLRRARAHNTHASPIHAPTATSFFKSPQTPHPISRRNRTSVTPACPERSRTGVPPALLTFSPATATRSFADHRPLILHRRMPHRPPTRRIPKMRKHRMYTTLPLRRIQIKLHPTILPRNIPLVMHHHGPQRTRTPASHQVPSPKIIPRIHQDPRRNHRQNHPLQNHTSSHSAFTPALARV